MEIKVDFNNKTVELLPGEFHVQELLDKLNELRLGEYKLKVGYNNYYYYPVYPTYPSGSTSDKFWYTSQGMSDQNIKTNY